MCCKPSPNAKKELQSNVYGHNPFRLSDSMVGNNRGSIYSQFLDISLVQEQTVNFDPI